MKKRGKTTKEKLKNQNANTQNQENVVWWKRKSVKPLLDFSMLLTEKEVDFLSNFEILEKIEKNEKSDFLVKKNDFFLESSALDLL